MSDHVEWADADLAGESATFYRAGDFTDSYGTTNDRPALVIDNGSGLIAIEGTEFEMKQMLARLTYLAETFPWPQSPTELDFERKIQREGR